jgi:hypothetical protein
MRSAFTSLAAFAFRWRSLLAILAATTPWLCPPPGSAATITLGPPTRAGSEPGRPWAMQTLRLTGMIVTGDADQLRQILTKLPVSVTAKSAGPTTIIELSSMGGSLTEGFEMGELFRKFNVIAVVRQHDFCLSSCALAFLAGNMHHLPSSYPTECNIEIGGKVAFHNFWLNRAGLQEVTSVDPVASRLQGFADARGGAALLIKYVGEMGLAPNFVASIMGRPVEDFLYIETVAQFLSYHVCPIGLNRPAIGLEAQAGNICNNSTVGSGAASPLQVTLIPALQAKRYLLERVQENMQSSSKSKGRLAAQLASGAVMRVKDEIDRLYEDLRGAGVALPEIVGPTFDVGRIRAGAYEAVCYVSLSPDAPDIYDVVVQGPKGLSEPLRLPPENCRRLFLFDQKEIVNPRPR